MTQIRLIAHFSGIVILTSLIFSIVSCQAFDQSVITLESPKPSPIGINSLATATLDETKVSTSTAIPASTLIVTQASTLVAPQSQESVLSYLIDNRGCELPCWWGVKPGETTLVRLRAGYGFQVDGFHRRDGTVLYEAYYDLLNSVGAMDYYIKIDFVELSGIVQAIEIDSTVYTNAQPKNLARGWRHYSIDQVLTRYGIPSRVQLQLMPPIELGAPPNYILTIVYENHAFWISYEGPATYDAKKATMRACPTFADVYRINLRLQSPYAKTSVFQTSAAGDEQSIEEVTGMSLRDFYKNFRDTSQQVCLEGSPTLP